VRTFLEPHLISLGEMLTVDQSGWCFHCTAGTLVMPWWWGGSWSTEDVRALFG